MMINKVVPLNELKCGNIFCVPYSLGWYMCTNIGYIKLDDGEAVPEIDSQDWEKVLLIYDRMKNITLAPGGNYDTYLTVWWE